VRHHRHSVRAGGRKAVHHSAGSCGSRLAVRDGEFFRAGWPRYCRLPAAGGPEARARDRHDSSAVLNVILGRNPRILKPVSTRPAPISPLARCFNPLSKPSGFSPRGLKHRATQSVHPAFGLPASGGNRRCSQRGGLGVQPSGQCDHEELPAACEFSLTERSKRGGRASVVRVDWRRLAFYGLFSVASANRAFRYRRQIQ
jgi:hypothetical protein